MKIKYFASILFFGIALGACKKEKEVDLSDFSVKADASTYHVGDSVTFSFTGNPPQISFFSGDVGNAYEYKDSARIDKLDKLSFSFETHNAPTQVVDFKLLISNDFSGIYNYENVTAATWTDVSSRFTFAEPAVWQTGWGFSGIADLSDVVKKNKPLYFAFKYVAPAVTAGAVPSRNYRTRAHLLKSVSKLGLEVDLANYAGMGWKQVKKDTTAANGSVITSSIMLFSPASTYKDEWEEWGISKQFQITDLNLGVDRSVPIKNYADQKISQYTYAYSKPGTYRAAFVATNKTAFNDQKVIKYVDITVVE